MKKWLRRIRGAVLMGLIWAVVWAPVGVLIGWIVDPTGAMDDRGFWSALTPASLAVCCFPPCSRLQRAGAD